MKWEPWEQYKTLTPVRLPISEPPCKWCKFFDPIAVFDKEGKFDGITCCHAEEMFSDYSCYRERGLLE